MGVKHSVLGVNELLLIGVMHSVQDVTTGCVHSTDSGCNHQQSIVHFNFLPALQA